MTTFDLVTAEDDVARRLGPEAVAALTTVRETWSWTDVDLVAEYRVLGADPEFVAHAHAALTRAAARGAAVRTGAVPFVADRAFTPDEAKVVERAVTCGLWLDAPWVASAFALLADVAVAPTDARSVPSQAVCHAIARGVRTAPTPEAVAALTAVTTLIRHAGLAKKLRRDVIAARRALAHRPDVALRLPTDTAPTTAQVTAWTTALEGCWALDASWHADRWRAAAHRWPAVSDVAARLVWSVDGAGAFGDARGAFRGTPDAFRGAPGAYVGADDRPVDVPDDATIRLWHPAAVSANERERWRDHVRRHHIDQPLRQVFREHYAASAPGFDDVECDARQLAGLARAQGWTSDLDGLHRVAGQVRVELRVDGAVYPGADGTVTVRGVRLGRVGRHPDPRRGMVLVPADRYRPLPAVPVSELVRSADLLVSASRLAGSAASCRETTIP